MMGHMIEGVTQAEHIALSRISLAAEMQDIRTEESTALELDEAISRQMDVGLTGHVPHVVYKHETINSNGVGIPAVYTKETLRPAFDVVMDALEGDTGKAALSALLALPAFAEPAAYKDAVRKLRRIVADCYVQDELVDLLEVRGRV